MLFFFLVCTCLGPGAELELKLELELELEPLLLRKGTVVDILFHCLPFLLLFGPLALNNFI